MKRVISLSLLYIMISMMTVRAQEVFNPSNPQEPGSMTAKLILLVDPVDGGSVNGGGAIVPGEKVSLNASPSSGFSFVNWTDAVGNVISTERSFQYIKGEGTETLIAHFSFNPSDPKEPDQLPSKLNLVAEEGGNASGGGYYKEGVSVSIHAYASSGFDFVGWYYDDGSLYSDLQSPSFTMVDHALTLTARFKFNPDSPIEPGDVNSKHRLKLLAGEGGTVSIYNNTDFINESTQTTIYAYTNTGYIFAGWYNGDELVSETSTYTFIMGATDLTLTAHFNYMPQSPGEPDEIKQRTFSFTLYNVHTKPGATAQFPILLTPRATLKDMTFQINFRPELNVDFEHIVIGETTEPYQVSCEDLGIDEIDGLQGYKYTLTGGTIDGSNSVIPILTFPVIIPEDAETATYHQIKINQIIMTNEDGTTQSARNRNGRISVFKNGDANGDDTVDIYDYIGVANQILGLSQDGVFIDEAGDVNDSGGIDLYDYIGVADIILYGSVERESNVRKQDLSSKEPVIEPE